MEDQADEIWGLAFVLLAVLVGLAVYGDVVGPAGRAVRTGTADFLGWARYCLPVGLAILGVYLLWRHESRQPGRVATGLVLAFGAFAGLLAVAGGKTTLHQPLREMGKAGGIAGAVIGVPMREGLGSWGAGVLLGALLFVALLVLTATRVRSVVSGGALALRVTGRAVAWFWSLCVDAVRGVAHFASTPPGAVRQDEPAAGYGAELTAASWAGPGPATAAPGTATSGNAETGTAGAGTAEAGVAGPGHRRAGDMAAGDRAAAVGAPGPEAGAGFAWAGLASEGEQDDHEDQDVGAADDAAHQHALAVAGAADGGGRPGTSGPGGAVLAQAGPGRTGAGSSRDGATAPGLQVGGAVTVGPAKGEQLVIDLNLPRQEAPSWRLPAGGLLRKSKQGEVDRRQVELLGKTLESALAGHGVETRLVGATVGPSVTRYELELGPGVKVQRVTALHRDIAYAMAAAEIRIQAPIPGRSAIGVEVPNRQRQTVSLGDMLSAPEAAAARHPLEVPAGRDIAGRPVMVNLAEMPHLLIAGATGSGKSSCINSMLTSVLMRATPDQVRLILVDPKRVELGAYSGLPHLLTNVVTVPKKAANALRWAVDEMERRYDLLAEVGMRDITGYNAAWDRGEFYFDSHAGAGDAAGEGGGGGAAAGRYSRLPFILVVVDELNDLMMVAARDVEESICRIAQMARAVGIHLVLATQRPSVDVITGLIKANIPSRLAFAVSSLADSRVVLDQAGAERLIGKGDMLLLTASSSLARRLQGPWVDEEDVRKVVAHWRRQAGPDYVEGVEGSEGGPGQAQGDGDDGEDLLEEAMELVVRSQLGSTSMLQRKLRVGFARAGRLMDLLEQRGVVGPSEGSKARAVLMTVEELDARRDL